MLFNYLILKLNTRQSCACEILYFICISVNVQYNPVLFIANDFPDKLILLKAFLIYTGKKMLS